MFSFTSELGQSSRDQHQEDLQAAEAGQAAEHALSQVADGVLPQVQVLQEAQAHEGRVLQTRQVVEGEVPAQIVGRRHYTTDFPQTGN